MCMERSLGAWHMKMHACMDEECGCFRHALSGNHVSLEVADQQMGGPDLAKGNPVRVDNEKIVITRHDARKMIADALFHSQTCGETEASGKIDLCIPDLRTVQRWPIRPR